MFVNTEYRVKRHGPSGKKIAPATGNSRARSPMRRAKSPMRR